jgi:uncharacterized protein (TIGR02231 family)
MSELSATAPVVEVTLLEDRARVIRRGQVAVPAGQVRIVIDGAAPVLVDKSLVATATGARVLDVRCARRVAFDPPSEAGADRSALERALTEARAALARADAEHGVIAKEAEAVAALRKAALRELAADAAWGHPPAPGDALARLDERDRELTARTHAALAARDHDKQQVADLTARVAVLASAAGREAAAIVVDLIADAAAEVALTLEYAVPGACWRPYHTATLVDGEVEFATDACVWQATGEDWRDAQLAFSTERPSLGASPPPLTDDVIRTQRKSEVIVAETRDQEIDQVGLGVDRVARAAAEVPGVDDGGTTQLLRPAHAATVLADGRPYRVPIGRFRAPAEVALVALPERAPVAFVRARLTNRGGRPILAGPVDLIMDAGPVGRTSILYVADGERCTIGFGPDAAVRIHREVVRDREAAGVLGSKNVTSVKVAVRVSNLGPAPRTLLVTERVPVSELEQVEIVVAPIDAWDPLAVDPKTGRGPAPTERGVIRVRERSAVDDDGMITWTATVPAHGRALCALAYEIRSAKKVLGL